MLSQNSIIKIFDGSGAKKALIINIANREFGTVGDTLVVVLKKVMFKKEKKLIKGGIVKAIIIQTKKIKYRLLGNYINSNINGAIILKKNEKDLPYSSRITRPVAIELRRKRLIRIVSIAPDLI